MAASVLTAVWTTAGVLPRHAAAEQAAEPTSVAGRLDAGANDACLVLPGGSLRCWGFGYDGELGYGNTDSVGATETPGSVGPLDLGAGRTVRAVSAGDYHTCAVLDDGTVRCWGFGGDGRLGYGNTNTIGATSGTTPATAGPVKLGPGRTATAITAGGAHTCAVLDDGSVRCWGFGFDGRLGYGNTNRIGDNETPDSVGPVDLGTGQTATAITAGRAHTCALLENGAVMCWGLGSNGQLGYGNTNNVGDSQTPGSVGPVDLGAGHTARAITAGDFHTCAILDDGSVRCWGFNGDGELGYGNTDTIGDDETPGSMGPVDLGPGRTAVAISAGGRHTCAVLDDGTVRCWGDGAFGQLGYGNTNNVGDDETPGSMGPIDLGPGRTAVAISAGGEHTCALLDNGALRCWGDGASGRLGYCNESNVGDSQTPGSAGPVNLEPGDGGTGCAIPTNTLPPSVSGNVVVRQTMAEAHGSWSGNPTGYRYQWQRCDSAGAHCAAIAGATARSYTLSGADADHTVRVVETASNAAGAGVPASSAPSGLVTLSDAVRARGLRSCLAALSSHARRAQNRTAGHGSSRQNTRARLEARRYSAIGRRMCLRRYGRTPGPVGAPRARGRGSSRIELDFIAAGTDGPHPPTAHGYLVKQSRAPIRSRRDFTHAQALCHGACRFAVAQLGTVITLTITNLRPDTTYYYAVAAIDDVTGRIGPRSPTVRARTASERPAGKRSGRSSTSRARSSSASSGPEGLIVEIAERLDAAPA